MTPETGFLRLFIAAVLGFVFGLSFDLVRPIRPRFFGDLLFLGIFGWGWLQFTFRICLGDLRMGHLFGIGLGFFLWQIGPGRFTKPICYRIWEVLHRIFINFLEIFKKILNFLFSRRRKSSTIG